MTTFLIGLAVGLLLGGAGTEVILRRVKDPDA